MATIKELKGRMQAALVAARDICKVAEDADRDFTAEEREKVKGYIEEANGLKAQIKSLEGDEALRKELEALGVGLGDGAKGDQPAAPGGLGKSIGERFVEAAAYRDWLKRFPKGQIPESYKGVQSPPIDMGAMKGILWPERKTLVTGDSATSGGAFVETDYTGIYEPLGRIPLVLRDLVAVRRTTSDLVSFVRQTTAVSQAAPTAEANVTTYTGATGEVEGEKPEAAVAYEQVTATVKTIAVWIPATKRALSDVGQLRGLLDQELRDDCAEELEDQILNGNGTGENFTGLFNTANILTQAWDTDLLTTIRKARTALRTTGRSYPTAILVHPNDAEALDLLKDSQGRYYFGGPSEGGVQRVWRVPVVECESVTEGTGLMGDFRKAVLWDREQTTVQVSDSHSDFFIRNMVAILAELRAAFGVIRPSAFITVDLASGS